MYKWANEVIPDNTVILSTHRSSAFYKHEVVSYEFRLFGGYTNEGYEYYLKIIKKILSIFFVQEAQKLTIKRYIKKL